MMPHFNDLRTMEKKKVILLVVFGFLLLMPLINADVCDIRQISHNEANIGDFPIVLQYQIVDVREIDQTYYNDSVIHSTCSLNLYSYGESFDNWAKIGNITGSIIESYRPYEIEGSKFTNYLGDVSFTLPLDSYEFQPDTVYAYLVECYCLNVSGTNQDLHNCFYGSDGSQTGYLGCSRAGNFTTGSDVNFTKKHNYLNLWLLISLIVTFGILGFAFKDPGLSVLSGILTVYTGMVILQTEIIIEGFTEPVQTGLSIIIILVGTYIILWSAIRKFFITDDDEDKQEMIIEEE